MLKRLKGARAFGNHQLVREIETSLKQINSRIQFLVRKDILKNEQSILKSKNSKRFFNYVNSKLKSKEFCPPLKLEDGTIISDPKCKANAFNEAFCSVFTQDNGVVPDTSIETSFQTLSDFIFDEYSVTRFLRV